MRQLHFISVCIFFSLFCWFTTIAQTVNIVYPQEFTEYALKNPMKGFRPGGDRVGNSNYPTTIVHHYIFWNEIENDSTDGAQKIIDYCNIKWKDYEKENVKVIPRIVIQWDWNSPNGNWPSDLTPGDWSSQKFKDRVVKLVYKLGQAWDNDARVAWVQTGLIGWWGEQEQPVGVHQDGWALRLGDAFTNAFKNKKLVVRNQSPWEPYGFEFGTYWDSYGHPFQSNVRNDIMQRNKNGRYLTQIVEGETAYQWGSDDRGFKDKYGNSPNETLSNDLYTDRIIDAIRELHCTGLGWLSSFSFDAGLDHVKMKSNASRIQNAFGYHFVIPEFSCASRVNQGQSLQLNFKVKNIGSAPFYSNWPLAVTLIDETTRQIVYKKIITDVDVTKWLPGSDYNLTTRTYGNPAQDYLITTDFQVPLELITGNYMIGLSILEPNSQTPGVFFAVKNFLKESQTQPLSRVGIGQNLIGDFNINATIFNNPNSDDTRYYSLSPTGTMYNLTTNNSLGGTLDINGGSYLENTTITLNAKPELGYQFTGWSGDASGTQNPLIVVMNSNKNIVANFSSTISQLPFFAFATNSGGSDFTAVDGTLFQADQNYSGGNTSNTSSSISGTTDDALYQKSRWSNSFSYNKDVPNGTYQVTLFFAETHFNSAGSRIFNVALEGATLINNLDVFALVGKNAAYQKTVTVDVVDGRLTIAFNPVVENPSVCGIKVDLITIPTFYKLTRNAVNGLISSSPTVGLNKYIANTNLTLTASALPGYKFTGWSGDIAGTVNPIVVNMDSNKNATAVFTLLPVFSLNINATDGWVNKTPFKTSYFEGSNVSLRATPNYGYVFSGWSGDISSTANPVIVNMLANKNITANFSPLPLYSLSVNATNGSVYRTPFRSEYVQDSTVSLKATPDFGYIFTGWGGDVSGTTNPITITMNDHKTVIANFKYVGTSLIFATNCGGSAYTSGGRNFSADVGFDGGITNGTGSSISGTSDDVLYQSERWGKALNYNIPITNGDYLVRLKFAEIYHNNQGARVFSISLQGNIVSSNLDIWSIVGKNAAYDEIHQVTVTNGMLNINLISSKDNAKISAIEITSIPQNFTPIFTQVAAICSGETIPALPNISNNGIEGTWSPALNNMETTTYTFTPNTAGVDVATMTIEVKTTTVPEVNATQTLTPGSTVVNLVAVGSNLKWYSQAVGGTELVSTTPIANGTYYATQTINGCESQRLGVTTTLGFILCTGSKVSNLTLIGGVDVKWYTSLTTKTALSLNTGLSSRVYYYTQNLGGTISARTAVLVSLDLASVASSIRGSSGTICYDTNKTLSLGNTARGTVQWQISNSPTGLFMPIAGATSTTLNTGNLTSTTFYNVIVTNGVCPSKTTVFAKVTVRPQSVAGTISGGEVSVCPITNSTSLVLTGQLGKIQWFSSTDNLAFQIVPNATTATYRAQNIASTTYYRVAVTNGSGCIVATSNSVAVTVKPVVNPGVLSGPLSIPFNTTATIFTMGYDEGAVLSWRSSTSLNGVYARATQPIVIEGSYTTAKLLRDTFFRVVVTKDGCSSTTSTFLVDVNTTVKLNDNDYNYNTFEVIAYPNPFSNTVKLDVSSSSKAPVEVKVFDILGRLIETRSVKSFEMSNQEIGNRYASGVYNLIIKQGANIKTLRVIKQ